MKNSTGIQLLRMVWNEHGTYAWEALNHSMLNALSLAIGARMSFAAEDLEEISSTMRPGYWLTGNGWEWAYGHAISCGNQSFIEAFEEWKKRKPFFANDVTGYRSEYTHGAWSRKRGRLAILFTVGDHLQKVTSITNERVIICQYKPDSRTPLLRYRYNHEELAKRYPAPNRRKLEELLAAHKRPGLVVCFWRCDEKGRPANGGYGTLAKAGFTEKIEGPLRICTSNALHGTTNPRHYNGSHWWIVGLHEPTQCKGDKFASLKRTFIKNLGQCNL